MPSIPHHMLFPFFYPEILGSWHKVHGFSLTMPSYLLPWRGLPWSQVELYSISLSSSPWKSSAYPDLT